MCSAGKFRLLWRLVLVLVALIFGGQVVAQAQTGARTQTGGRGGQSSAYRSQKNVVQTRKMTIAERRAAAQRTAERKAAHGMKNQVGRNAQQGVKK